MQYKKLINAYSRDNYIDSNPFWSQEEASAVWETLNNVLLEPFEHFETLTTSEQEKQSDQLLENAVNLFEKATENKKLSDEILNMTRNQFVQYLQNDPTRKGTAVS